MSTGTPSPSERGPGGEAPAWPGKKSTGFAVRTFMLMDELHDHVFTADKRLYGKLDMKGRARAMRHQPTMAEGVLWQVLRGGQLGAKFRRQHPIDRYVVDFVCIDARLVIEVDGGAHLDVEHRDYDAGRSAMLAEMGFRVLRFSNEMVLREMDAVQNELRAALPPAL